MNIYADLTAFIRSIYKEKEKFIPLHDPRFIGNEKKYLNECIDSNFVSSVGEFVSRFEGMCAEFTGAKHAIAAMNGTAALHISLILAGVNRGDEVLTQALTFIATANPISYLGAHPVFLDVDEDTMGLSPIALQTWLLNNVEMKVSSKSSGKQRLPFNKNTGRRIAACLPMHTFGHPTKIEDTLRILNEYNIPLIEDSAESIGSYYKNKHTGTYGKIGILSFNGNKVITTGGGGMILTDDDEIAVKAKHLTTQAKLPHQWEYRHDMIGYNYRLTNIAAALGCAQMETLDKILESKRSLANKYEDYFSDSEFTFFKEPQNSQSNYWLNVVITNDRKQRDELLRYTNAKGVMTRPIWELMSRLDMFKNCQTDELKNSIWFADRVVNIPSAPVF